MKIAALFAAASVVACAHDVPAPATPQPVASDARAAPDAAATTVKPDKVVVLKLYIDATGQVVKAIVVQSAGQYFDVRALESMRTASFKPARTRDGTPVPCTVIWRYRFEGFD